MAVTLSIADNTDGTGATATISGSSGGSVTVWIGRVTGELGTVVFSSAGSRTGNGTLAIATTTKARYFGYAVDGTDRSNLVYFAVTETADAVATRLMEAIRDTLSLLAIPPVANIYEQMFADESNIKYPCTILSVEGLSESITTKLNSHDDYGRPVKVMFADRADRWDHTKLAQYESWRQAGIRCFVSQQLAGVPEVVSCVVEPYVIVDPNARQYQHMVAGFAVRATTREPRGIGV